VYIYGDGSGEGDLDKSITSCIISLRSIGGLSGVLTQVRMLCPVWLQMEQGIIKIFEIGLCGELYDSSYLYKSISIFIGYLCLMGLSTKKRSLVI
jgi:hypothetical protein